MQLKTLRLVASISLITLIVLSVAWEWFLAPLRPGGSLLILKSLPLLWPLMGILKGKRYTYQWASMLILLYFTEGIVRTWSDTGDAASLAALEIALSFIFFVCAIFYARVTRKLAQ